MRKILLLFLFFLNGLFILTAQNITITDDDSHEAHSSAVLDVFSQTKGLLIPRMTTTQMNNIDDPIESLMIYNTDEECYYHYNGSAWITLNSTASDLWQTNNDAVFLQNPSKFVGIGTYTPTSKLEVVGDVSFPTNEPLFKVLNNNGDTVFAVYNEGVRVNISDGSKAGSPGGFAIGGITTKQGGEEYFRISRDSARIRFNSNTKAGSPGGFAIGGIASKGNTDFFNVSGNNFVDTINPSEPRVVWYPQKEAFLVGRVLIESVDSVGTNSFATGYESKAIGNWSQAMGYKSIARGNSSTAIGNEAISQGDNSFAFGDSARATGQYSYAFGNVVKSTGKGAFAFGVLERFDPQPPGDTTVASGDYSIAIGVGAKATDRTAVSIGVNTVSDGQGSVALGYDTYAYGGGSAAIGMYSEASAPSAIALGGNSIASGQSSFAAGQYCEATAPYATSIGCLSEATGNYSTAIGYNAKTNNYAGSIVIGDGSSWPVPVQATAENQFTVRAVGGYQFFTDVDQTQNNGVFISSGTGNVGIGTNTPEQKLHINDVMRLEPRATAPDNAQKGDIYFSSVHNTLMIYTGAIGGWKKVTLEP